LEAMGQMFRLYRTLEAAQIASFETGGQFQSGSAFREDAIMALSIALRRRTCERSTASFGLKSASNA
jgi:hypothetical protein